MPTSPRPSPPRGRRGRGPRSGRVRWASCPSPLDAGEELQVGGRGDRDVLHVRRLEVANEIVRPAALRLRLEIAAQLGPQELVELELALMRQAVMQIGEHAQLAVPVGAGRQFALL